MTAPSSARRRRYHGRDHQLDTQPGRRVPGHIEPGPATVVPPDVKWKVAPGALVAHAFSAGPGWMRSACRQERWTVALQDVLEDGTPCAECWELTAAAS